MKYCAFLRGVNVNGTSMKMVEVCVVFSKAGMSNVASVLASGNIIFESDQDSSVLKEILEKSMSLHFNYEAFLFLKSKDEVSAIFNQNPFPKNDTLHVYSFVGIDGVEDILLEEFANSKKVEFEDAKIVNGYFYWQVPKGNTLDSTFGKVLGKKLLKDKMTSRNINTFEKILKK